MACRTLRDVILTSFLLSLAGIVIDADHWWAISMGWPPDSYRWLHYTLASRPLVHLLYLLIVASIAYAFASRWGLIDGPSGGE